MAATNLYVDDKDGNRVAATAKYYDTPLGVRQTLSGVVRIDDPAPPPPPPPPPSGYPKVLWYPSSRITDAGSKALFGQDPMGWSSYWQQANYTQISTVEAARMAAGTDVVASVALVKDTTAAPTASRDNVNGMIAWAAGTGPVPPIVLDVVTRAQTVAAAYPNNELCIHPMGEVEVSYNQQVNGKITTLASLFAYYSNDETAIMTALGKYHDAFFKLCDQVAPAVKRTYWMGGSSSTANNRIRNTFFSAINTPPDYVTGDPYNNAHTGETPVQTWTPIVNQYRATTGAHHAHWLRWGQPPISLNESGINHNVYTDAEMAAWIGQWFEAMRTLNIVRAIYFNSTGPNGAQFITGGAYPQAVAAFSGEITQAKLALAA